MKYIFELRDQYRLDSPVYREAETAKEAVRVALLDYPNCNFTVFDSYPCVPYLRLVS